MTYAPNVPLSTHFTSIPDLEGYLARMAAPLREKLYMAQFIPKDATDVLDVGCADGTITLEMAAMFPNVQFHGIDLNAEFIRIANERARERGLTNVIFECVYLRQLLERPRRYHAVQFLSVLHEFFTYGEGISSVVKALADAHELLFVNGVTNIRDMILDEMTKKSDFRVDDMRKKIEARINPQIYADFVARWGRLETVATVNHLLLKYMYENNWKPELEENYLAVNFEHYEQIFDLLGMKLLYERSYTLAYLENKWAVDFGLTPDEISGLRSTTILVARKMPAQH